MKQLIIFVAIVLSSFPCAAQWQTASGNDKTIVFGVHDTSLFVSSPNEASGNPYVVRYVPTAALDTRWVLADTGIGFTTGPIGSFANLGRFFFAGEVGEGDSYRSSDNGAHWELIANGPICSNGTYLLCNGIYRSRDSGNDWLQNSFEQVANLSVTTFGCNGACIFAMASNGLWRSLDSGSDTSWKMDTAPISGINSFAFVNSITFASNGSGTIIKSTDSGIIWSQITLPRRTFTSLASKGSFLFAGTDSGVFVSLDSGGSWHAENDGLGNFLNVNALCVFDTFLFVNAASGGSWYTAFRPLREMIDTTQSSVVQTPEASDTIEIYPNPLQGIVIVQSEASLIEHVSLLDVLGREVFASSPRTSEVSLDLSKLPSGTYFLQVSRAKGTEVRKMVRE
jgi:Secretion system C-terminal sorting domain